MLKKKRIKKEKVEKFARENEMLKHALELYQKNYKISVIAEILSLKAKFIMLFKHG